MRLRNTDIILLCFMALVITSIEPSFANKFETIGSGVSGSVKIKKEYLKIISYVTGTIMLIAGVLAVTMRNKNSQALNYTMWKSSAIVFFILSFITLGLGFYL